MLGRLSIVLVSAGCVLLLGCGSGGTASGNSWSQTGSSFHATWTVPSATSIDLQLAGATSVSSCSSTSNGKSEPGTFIKIQGEPAVFFPIGTTLRAGASARTTCHVMGTITGVSAEGVQFRHTASP